MDLMTLWSKRWASERIPATPALDQVKDDFFFDLRIREVQAEIVNCTHVSKIKKDFWIDREEQGVLADLSKTQFVYVLCISRGIQNNQREKFTILSLDAEELVVTTVKF